MGWKLKVIQNYIFHTLFLNISHLNITLTPVCYNLRNFTTCNVFIDTYIFVTAEYLSMLVFVLCMLFLSILPLVLCSVYFHIPFCFANIRMTLIIFIHYKIIYYYTRSRPILQEHSYEHQVYFINPDVTH